MAAAAALSEQVSVSGKEEWARVGTQTTAFMGHYAPNALAAIAVLLIGWIVALAIAAIVRSALQRMGLDRRLSDSVAVEGADHLQISGRIGKGVFYLIMLFVLVAFFQTLGLTIVTQPLTAFLNQLFEYAPRLIAAGVLLFLAWIVANVLRFVVRQLLTATMIDRRLSREAGVEKEESLPVAKTLSDATYWLVYLLFLPALLDALAVPGLLAPVRDMVTKVLGFLPNLLAAAVILGVGWFVARIVQRIATNLLAAAGADRLSQRVGLSQALGESKLSAVLGLLIYILILVPVIVGSLNALQMEGVTGPASQMLNTILGTLPGILAAVLVIGVAYVVASVIAGLTTNMLSAVGFDKLPARLGLAAEPVKGRRTPSQIAGTIVLFAVVLFAIMQALSMLGFNLLAGMMYEFLTFAGHVLLGLAVFGFGLFLAKFVADMIRDSGIENARLLATIARVAILVLAGAMGLRQMNLAQEIVTLVFGLTLGAVAVAAAIAFGIGGRNAAKRLVDDFVKSRQNGDK
ncbi:MAG: mechanosensitive ion channel [Thermoguttaceae bacterium]